MNHLNITIFGLGYVGMSLAALLGTRHNVSVFDTDQSKMSKVKSNKSTIEDKDIQNYLDQKISKINVVENLNQSIKGSDFCIIATPTNFDEEKNKFDTNSVEDCIHQVLKANAEAVIIIKSTLPLGFISRMRDQTGSQKIIFCPEFLQEGTALSDNLNPERIVVGDKTELGQSIAKLFLSVCTNNSTRVLLASPTEAECVKLFANNYLALRVAFFNELDSFAWERGLDTEEIIRGVCGDRRIGDFYNNPSFGFGGYCLPKDVSQLESEITRVENFTSPVLTSISASNSERKKIVVKHILEKEFSIIGIYRVNMKTGSENFRESAVIAIISNLLIENKKVIVYEPLWTGPLLYGCEVINDFEKFNSLADVIVANRCDELLQTSDKTIITRDIFNNN